MIDARAERVRASVHAAWREAVQRRTGHRTRTMLAAGRWATAAAVVAFLVAQPPPPVDQPIATVARSEGGAALRVGQRLWPGGEITTGRGARLALDAGADSIRVDEHSRVRLLSPRAFELSAGALYVDRRGNHGPIEVRTPAGTVTDIGTQFEVRVLPHAVRVRVRSGAVMVRRAGGPVTAAAHTELVLTANGVETRPVDAFGDEWAWMTDLAPALAIDGRRLDAVLTQLAHEQGWTLVYEGAAVRRIAADTILHGSVDGLDAEAALSVALTIADLSYTLERGELHVWRPSSR